MRTDPLRSELVALIHHIELNRAGWWDAGIAQLVVAILDKAPRALTPAQISKLLRSTYSIHLLGAHDHRLKRVLESLVVRGAVIRQPPETYILTEAHRLRAREEQARVRQADKAAYEEFAALLAKHLPSTDAGAYWTSLNDRLLSPIITHLGARTYGLITGKVSDLDDSNIFLAYVEGINIAQREAIKVCVRELFQSSGDAFRRYVLDRLASQFVLRSLHLSADEVDALVATAGERPRFVLYVDTNVLLSFADLHENPFHEAAYALADLVAAVSKHLDASLHALLRTVGEFQSAIEGNINELKGLYFSPDMPGHDLVALGGIGQRLLRMAAETGRTFTAEEALRPILVNLEATISRSGTKLDPADTTALARSSAVAADIEAELAEPRLRGKRAKSRQTIQHDVLLWHYVRSLRRPHVSTILEASYWIVTEDTTFLRFDRERVTRDGHGLQVCVDPAQLCGILQFWIGRTPEVEKAILGALGTFIKFEQYDVREQQVSIAILRECEAMGVDGAANPRLVGRVLVDKQTRAAFAEGANIGERRSSIREAVVGEVITLRSERDELQRKVDAGVGRVAELQRHLLSEHEEVKGAEDELKRRADALATAQDRVEEERKRGDELAQRVGNLERTLGATREAEDRRVERSRSHRAVGRFLVSSVPLVIFLFLAGGWVGKEVWQRTAFGSNGIDSLVGKIVGVSLGVLVCTLVWGRDKEVSETWFYKHIWAGWIIAAFAEMLRAIVAHYVALRLQ